MARAVKLAAIVFLCLFEFLASYASAQSSGAAEGLEPASMSDARQLLKPGSRRYSPGYRIGAFIVRPDLEASIAFDDNIFARRKNVQSDRVLNLETKIHVISDWSRHSLELFADGGGRFYEQFDAENRGYADVGARGLINIKQGVWLRTYARYRLAYEARGSGGSAVPFDKPVQVQSAEGEILFHKAFNRLWVELGGEVERKTYKDTALNGVIVDQSYRDGVDYIAIARTGYDVSSRTSLFVESRGAIREFNDGRFKGDRYSVLAGVRYQFTELLNGEIAAGYLHFTSEGGLSDIQSWTYRGRVNWAVSPLMSVALVGYRDISTPTNIGGASNNVESDIAIRADYAFRRDLTLTAGAGGGWIDYVDIGREDQYLKFSAGAEYQFRPNLSFWANYSFTDYDVDGVPGLGYDRTIASFGIRARY